ncbi:MAG: hypothetical protein D3923_09810 [Candidatus Electrothrix sp. AR3]|nr:hypothetical protein [Candidatus Electrothrix sp. AR3]
MNKSLSNYRVEIASDVCDRDGIGLEVYQGKDLVLEIFRDDTENTRKVALFRNEVDLQLIEEAIKKFKTEVPWEFIDYDK